jgi:hypothetical protein
VRLVLGTSPGWRDLFDEIAGFADSRDKPGHDDKNRFYQETE